MNKKTIFNTFSYQIRKSTLVQLWSAITGLIMSLLIVFLIMTFDNPDTYTIVSPVICPIALAVSGLGLGLRYLTLDFTNAVKMGVTRKNYLAGTCISYAATIIFSLILTFLSTFVETAAAKLLYTHAESRGVLASLGIIPLLGCGIALFALCLILGAIILKAGLKGAAVIYFTLCFAPSLITSRIEQIRMFLNGNSFIHAFASTNIAVKLIFAAAVIVAALVFCTRIYLKKDIA